MNMIVTADWHLRDSVPKCLAMTQTEWYELQQDMLNQILNVCIDTQSDLYVVGDIFDNNNDCSFKLVQMVQNLAKCLFSESLHFRFIAGNHDEKYHDNNLSNSAIGILLNSENCFMLMNGELLENGSYVGASNFGEEPRDGKFIFIHTLTMPSKDVPNYIECETPQSLIDKFPSSRYIFTGDYHKSFVETYNGCVCINCGCTLIEKADFTNYNPRVFYVDTENDCYSEEYLITDLYKFCKTEKKESSEVIEQLTSKLSKEQITLDYQNNLEKAIESESEPIKEKVRSWL